MLGVEVQLKFYWCYEINIHKKMTVRYIYFILNQITVWYLIHTIIHQQTLPCMILHANTMKKQIYLSNSCKIMRCVSVTLQWSHQNSNCNIKKYNKSMWHCAVTIQKMSVVQFCVTSNYHLCQHMCHVCHCHIDLYIGKLHIIM